jgi:hypothetical protein
MLAMLTIEEGIKSWSKCAESTVRQMKSVKHSVLEPDLVCGLAVWVPCADHGADRDRRPSFLSQQDVVLTTYSVLASDAGKKHGITKAGASIDSG